MSMVHHPNHYNVPGKKECIEAMLDEYGPLVTAIFCLTNAYKYNYRSDYKGQRDSDIRKATWYIGFAKNRCMPALNCQSTGDTKYDSIIYIVHKLFDDMNCIFNK